MPQRGHNSSDDTVEILFPVRKRIVKIKIWKQIKSEESKISTGKIIIFWDTCVRGSHLLYRWVLRKLFTIKNSRCLRYISVITFEKIDSHDSLSFYHCAWKAHKLDKLFSRFYPSILSRWWDKMLSLRFIDNFNMIWFIFYRFEPCIGL